MASPRVRTNTYAEAGYGGSHGDPDAIQMTQNPLAAAGARKQTIDSSPPPPFSDFLPSSVSRVARTLSASKSGDENSDASSSPPPRRKMTDTETKQFKKATGSKRLSQLEERAFKRVGGKGTGYLSGDGAAFEDGALPYASADENKNHLKKLRETFALLHPVEVTLGATRGFCFGLSRHILQLSFVVSTIYVYSSALLNWVAVGTVFYLVLLTYQLQKKAVSDVAKQTIYYDLFAFGAMVDFDNEAGTRLVKVIHLFGALVIAQIALLPSEGYWAVRNAAKGSMAIATVNACVEVVSFYMQLQKREDNLLSFNRMFENDHSAARSHCKSLTVVPFRVIKAIFCYIVDEKAAADERLIAIVREKKLFTEFKYKRSPMPEKVHYLTGEQCRQLFDVEMGAVTNLFEGVPGKEAVGLKDIYELKIDDKTKDEALPLFDRIVFKKITTHELYLRSLMVLEAKGLDKVGRTSEADAAFDKSKGLAKVGRTDDKAFEDEYSKAVLKQIKDDINAESEDQIKNRTLYQRATCYKKTRDIMVHVGDIYEDSCTSIDLKYMDEATRRLSQSVGSSGEAMATDEQSLLSKFMTAWSRVRSSKWANEKLFELSRAIMFFTAMVALCIGFFQAVGSNVSPLQFNDYDISTCSECKTKVAEAGTNGFECDDE